MPVQLPCLTKILAGAFAPFMGLCEPQHPADMKPRRAGEPRQGLISVACHAPAVHQAPAKFELGVNVTALSGTPEPAEGGDRIGRNAMTSGLCQSQGVLSNGAETVPRIGVE